MSEIIRLHDGVKCCGVGCRSKEICWRYKQPPAAKRQWSMFEQGLGLDDDRCDNFLSIPEAKNET